VDSLTPVEAVPAAVSGGSKRGLGSARLDARPAERELTTRALLAGAGIGVLLAAGNVYTCLKSTFIDGGALTATLLSFAGFGLFRKLLRRPFGPLENNTVQTVAASAAVMAYASGLMAPIPALELMGQHPAMWAVGLWGLLLSAMGILVAVVLRARLIEDEQLPFPSGAATAVLIRAIHADHRSAAGRSRAMVLTAAVAAAATWWRDGSHAVLPAVLYVPVTVAGLSASSLTLGVAVSPLMAATGVLVGARTAWTLLAGSLLGWLVLVPAVRGAGWVTGLGYSELVSWLAWPALGMMLSGTFVSGLLGLPRLAVLLPRVWQDARGALGLGDRHLVTVAADRALATPTGNVRTTRSQRAARLQETRRAGLAAPRLARPRWLRPVIVLPILFLPISLGLVGVLGFGYSPLHLGGALVAALVLASVCARAAGETDIAPVGQFGTLVQIGASAVGGPTVSILSGSVVAGSATQTAQSLWAFRAGHDLGARPRAQLVAQLLGAVVGTVVAVPTYLLVTRAYGLGSEQMPAISALSWKATSLALGGGLAMAAGSGRALAFGLAFTVGAVLSLLARRRRWQKLLPSSTALGIGLLMPVSLSAAGVCGIVLVTAARRLATRGGPLPGPAATELEETFGSAAAGALAGESLMGVAIAALTAAGMLR
jgi:uncharacterized oligopeptide transporter (OPT) family protein